MAELDITTIVVTPTMHAVVSFAPSTDPTLDHYTLTGTSTTPVHTVTVTGTASPLTTGVLVANASYTWEVEAVDDEDGTLDTGAPTVAAASCECTAGAVLRQAMCDTVVAANITIGGRALIVLRDAYGRPRSLYQDDNISRRTPLLEIAHAKLRGYAGTTCARNVEIYSIECTLVEAVPPGRHDEGLEAAMVGRDRVRLAVDKDLYGTVGGVHDGSWQWADGETIYDDQVVAQRFTCTIQVQSMPGSLPYTP